MLAMIISVFGAIVGGIMQLAVGIPLMAFCLLRWLPFDRRLWWTVAAGVAYMAVKDAILRDYDYAVPTVSPDRFYFDAHVFGGVAGVILVYLAGVIALSLFFRQAAERPLNKPIAYPLTVVVVLVGATAVANLRVPTETKRAALQQRRTSLIAAIKSGNASQFRDCLARGPELTGTVEELEGHTMMGYAISHELVDIAKILLDPPRGDRSDVNARAFRDVLETQNTQLIDTFLQSKQRKKYLGRLLRASIANGDDKYFEYAMKLKADPDACEGYDTPLSLCAKHNRVNFAETLITLGAEVNGYHGSPDLNRGSTPLVTAADHGHIQMVDLLLKHGAKVNRQVTGNRSALQGACRSGHAEIVERLLQEGADVHYRTVTGATSLHWAIEPGHWSKNVSDRTKAEIVELLLRAGIDPQIEYRYGTALQLAERHSLNQVVDVLR